MRPRRTAQSNKVFHLPGGTEDNDLWVDQDAQQKTITSTWEFDDEERAMIAAGGTLDLVVWGEGTPPVALEVSPLTLEERKS